jgi:lipoprotein-anchoring transpeptidase ErfK/SrfK
MSGKKNGLLGRAAAMFDGSSFRQAGTTSKIEDHHRRAGIILALTSCAVIAATLLTGARAQAAVGGKGRAGKAKPAVDAVSPDVAAITSEAQHRLADFGYWTDGSDKQPADHMRFALLAFQRVEGRNQTGKLDQAEMEALKAAARPTPRETGYAHIEVDLKRQVLLAVNADSVVSLVLPISSGSGKLYTFEGKTARAVTPRGRFRVYNKISGWRKAPLGMIYYPCYFNEGFAIHGSGSIPNYPASHGCVRIPIVDAKQLSEIAPVGAVVLVYD